MFPPHSLSLVSRLFLLALLWSFHTGAIAQTPGQIAYQGRVAVNGVNFHGQGQFKFALITGTYGGNPGEPLNLWSNDGSLPGPDTTNAPTGHVTLDCDRGLYSVLLGNPSAGMIAVPAGIFQSYPDVRLRVWFNDGTTGWQKLSPDQRLVSVGYAMMAQNAVAAQSAQSIPDGSISTAKLADTSVTASKLALGSVSSVALASSSVTTGALANNSVQTAKISDGSVTAAKLATDSVTSAKITDGTIATIDLANDSVTGAKVLDGTLGLFDLADESVDGAKVINGSLTGLDIQDASLQPSLLSGGNVTASLHFNPPGVTAPFTVNDTVKVANLNADWFDGLDSTQFLRTTGAASLTLNAPAVLTFGAGNRQTISLSGATYGIGVQTDTLYQRSGNGFAWYVQGSHSDTAGDPGGGVKMMSMDGQGVLRLHATNARIETPVLTITGGADLAESFEVTDGHALEPGEVLVIDELRPGWLKRSENAYDTRVAGIVSGAGGVRPGLTLAQKDVMEGSHHVALTGRVYVKADTSEGAIRPGDLITTSARPGHACRVADRDRAQGAILGKAMTALEDGEGLILVLVSLQ